MYPKAVKSCVANSLSLWLNVLSAILTAKRNVRRIWPENLLVHISIDSDGYESDISRISRAGIHTKAP